MTRWYTADLHIGHKRIIELCGRPFADVEEMDETLLANWRALVAPDDDIFVLGDMVMGDFAAGMEKVAALPGRKSLIPGNHDRCLQQVEKRGIYEDAGFSVWDSVSYVQVCDVFVLASHFPYTGDSQDVDRFAEYRPRDTGDWLLHGHVHKKWRVNGNQLNVGVDVWNFRPVSETQILAILTGDET